MNCTDGLGTHMSCPSRVRPSRNSWGQSRTVSNARTSEETSRLKNTGVRLPSNDTRSYEVEVAVYARARTTATPGTAARIRRTS